MKKLAQNLKNLFVNTGDHQLHQTAQLWSSMPSDNFAKMLEALHPYVFGFEIVWTMALLYLVFYGTGNLVQTLLACASILWGVLTSH